MNPAVLLLVACALSGAEVPAWILDSIARVESSSYYDASGRFHYVDKRRGKDGEYGPWQMTPVAFRQISRRGEPFWKLETDVGYAKEMATRYLLWNYRRFHDWDKAISAYNPNDRRYLAKVKAAR